MWWKQRPVRLALLVVAMCAILLGAGLVLHAQHPELTRLAGSHEKPRATTSATAHPSPTASPHANPTLSGKVAGRAEALRKLAEKAADLSRKRKRERPISTFTFAQFNMLGASHRGNIGMRTSLSRGLFQRYSADVIAMQEFSRSQRAVFNRIAGGTFDVYPGNSGRSIDGENSVAWRRDRFELVSAGTRPYPYFGGNIRNMPRVLLRDKKSGTQFYVTSYHNPASCCGHGNQARQRAIAVGRQIADANALRRQTQRPLIVAGDMNDRATYFCRMARGAGMHSADGSVYSGGCRVAGRPWIDWIMGTSDVTFSGYVRDRGATVRRASDHPILIVQVSVKGRAGDAIHRNDTPPAP